MTTIFLPKGGLVSTTSKSPRLDLLLHHIGPGRQPFQRVLAEHPAAPVADERHVGLADLRQKLVLVDAPEAIGGHLELPLGQLALGPPFAFGLLAQLPPHMRQRRNQKAARSARRVDDPLARLGVHDLDHHFDDVARREKLALRAAQGRADEHLEGVADGVAVGLHNGVVLEFADDVGEAVGVELDRVAGLEHVAVGGVLDPLEHGLDALLDFLGRFVHAGAEGNRVVGVGLLFVENLAEQDVDDFLGERFVPRDAGGHTGQMIPQIAEHGLEVRRLLEVLPLVEPDVLDPLAFAGDVGQASRRCACRPCGGPCGDRGARRR